MEWKLALAGLLVGALVGLTGMGSGSLMTPILIFLFGFNPSVAIGTDILHGAVFKTVGAAGHRMLGTVHARAFGLDGPRQRPDVPCRRHRRNVAEASLRRLDGLPARHPPRSGPGGRRAGAAREEHGRPHRAAGC